MNEKETWEMKMVKDWMVLPHIADGNWDEEDVMRLIKSAIARDREESNRDPGKCTVHGDCPNGKAIVLKYCGLCVCEQIAKDRDEMAGKLDMERIKPSAKGHIWQPDNCEFCAGLRYALKIIRTHKEMKDE